MPLSKSLSMLSAPLAALTLLVAPRASAETLVYVTSTFIGTVDSSHPAVDTTPGGNGPLQYSLPSGYFAIGAKVSQGTLYLLASTSTTSTSTASSTCQLFSVNTVTGGSAGVTAVGASYTCPSLIGTIDFAFFNGSSGASEPGAYVIADGANVLSVPAGGGAPTSISINGGAGNVQGIVDVGSSPNDNTYAMDVNAMELVQLNLATGAETNVTSLSAVTLGFFGNSVVALDYSTTSSNFYIYANQYMYSVTSTANGTVTPLGATPGGVVTVVLADGLAINNSGVYRSSGAFAPALLLPLAAMAFLRRRRQSRI